MKNITVSLDDETYRAARIHAAAHDTSVSAMVKEYLREISDQDNEFIRRKNLQDKTIKAILATSRFSASDRLSRDEIHARHDLS